MIKNKKAISLWISWVLLMAFMIMLSAFMFNWISGLTKSQAADIEKRSAERVDCEDVAVTITAACQTTQSILLDIANVKDFKVDAIAVRLYDPYGNSENKEKNITIRPKKSERVEFVKQGAVKTVELYPIIYFKGNTLLCRNNLAYFDKVKYC